MNFLSGPDSEIPTAPKPGRFIRLGQIDSNPWKINKTNKFQYISIGSEGLAARPSFTILQKTPKFLEISRNFSKFLEISQNFSEFLKISQNFSEFLEISQIFSGFLKILENLPRPPENPSPDSPEHARISRDGKNPSIFFKFLKI